MRSKFVQRLHAANSRHTQLSLKRIVKPFAVWPIMGTELQQQRRRRRIISDTNSFYFICLFVYPWSTSAKSIHCVVAGTRSLAKIYRVRSCVVWNRVASDDTESPSKMRRTENNNISNRATDESAHRRIAFTTANTHRKTILNCVVLAVANRL